MEKKLTEQELEAFRRVALRGDGNSLIKSLVDHIDAMEAERVTTMQQVETEAYQAGAAVGEVIKEQTDRIAALESIMARVAALGVKRPTENLGIAAGRMAYMRDSLRAALKGDLTLLEAAEHMFNESEKANDPE